MSTSRKIRHLKIAPAARSQFPGHQPDQRKPAPLSQIEWTEKLLLRVLERRSNGIHRGKRHGCTSRNKDSVAMKVPPEAIRVNGNRRGYSYRNASTGSSFEARSAGTRPLMTPTKSRTSEEIVRVMTEMCR